MRSSMWLVGVIASVSAVIVPSVFAQHDPPQVAQARIHFGNGERFYENDEFGQSLLEFRRTYDLLREAQHRNAPLVLYNIARCYVQLGREREAIDMYEQFLADAPADAPLVIEARNELRELRARVSLDSRGGGISPIGPIIAAVGGAAIVAGGILGGLALVADASADDGCVDARCPPANAERADEARLLAGAADALLFGGIGVAALGVVLVFVLPADTEPAPVHAACDERGCTVLVRGRF